jgi:hypothetical protein
MREPGPPGWGSPRWDSKIWTVSSAGFRLKSDCSSKAQRQFNSKLQTRPLVSEGVTKYQSRSCLKEISWRKKNWSQVPDGRLTPGQTGRLTVSRKLTSTSTKTDKWQTRLLVREGAPKRQYSNFEGEKTKISGQKSQIGLDTKAYWLADRQS